MTKKTGIHVYDYDVSVRCPYCDNGKRYKLWANECYECGATFEVQAVWEPPEGDESE